MARRVGAVVLVWFWLPEHLLPTHAEQGSPKSAWLIESQATVESFCRRQHDWAEPMQYSIPTRKWNMYEKLRAKPKTVDFAPLIPGDPSTYAFKEEGPYLEMYGAARYCITKKKGGWDCLRHYEILLAGCVPYFLDLRSLPDATMVYFPKHLVRQLMHLPGVPSEDAVLDALKYRRPILIDYSIFPESEYEVLRSSMLDFVARHLLSRKRATDLRIRHSNVLVHSLDSARTPVDYMRDLLIVGLVERGIHVYTTFNSRYIFDDFPVEERGGLWGFLYERSLPVEAKALVHVLGPGQLPPTESFSYMKTTQDNRGFPFEDEDVYRHHAAEVYLDANDIWAPHPESKPPAQWFRRELFDCQELSRPAGALLAVLDSGVLWECGSDSQSGGYSCPDLLDAARLWQSGLQHVRGLQAYRDGWQNDALHDTLSADIDDFLQTPHLHPDFVDRYRTIASNARQFLDTYRSLVLRTDRTHSAGAVDTAYAFLSGADLVSAQGIPGRSVKVNHSTWLPLAACGARLPSRSESYPWHDVCSWGSSPARGVLSVLTSRAPKLCDSGICADLRDVMWTWMYGIRSLCAVLKNNGLSDGQINLLGLPGVASDAERFLALPAAAQRLTELHRTTRRIRQVLKMVLLTPDVGIISIARSTLFYSARMALGVLGSELLWSCDQSPSTCADLHAAMRTWIAGLEGLGATARALGIRGSAPLHRLQALLGEAQTFLPLLSARATEGQLLAHTLKQDSFLKLYVLLAKSGRWLVEGFLGLLLQVVALDHG
ncbi:unnamed protein product [Polarella glacialis]|uniref:Uncharacterized protein n=1 Tax=Polarella glacialis TaxID=89957 RepID=A0A813IMF1_POLGL|nr:unnamed protein product [Polarella glacialis]